MCLGHVTGQKGQLAICWKISFCPRFRSQKCRSWHDLSEPLRNAVANQIMTSSVGRRRQFWAVKWQEVQVIGDSISAKTNPSPEKRDYRNVALIVPRSSVPRLSYWGGPSDRISYSHRRAASLEWELASMGSSAVVSNRAKNVPSKADITKVNSGNNSVPKTKNLQASG
jgi:hypothetical protein